MGLPFTKTITLGWDGANWRDQETGAIVIGVEPLHGPWPGKRDALPQDNDIQAAREWRVQELEEVVWRILSEHVVTSDFYFVNDPTKLATYGYVRDVIRRTDADVERLAARVAELAHPWWRRWFR